MAVLSGWDLLAGAVARLRSYARALLHREDVEGDIHEEFQHHLAMRAADLVRNGVPEHAAAQQARREFGHIDSRRADAREARGFRSLDQLRLSWLDVKLALRMLMKHPLLSLAAIFALAAGIPVGLAPAHVARAVEAPLPGDTDNRIRALRVWNAAATGVGTTTYADFTFWETELQSFSSLAAFRTSSYSVASDDGRAALVPGAELSAATFPILRAAPRLGRTLGATDAVAGAPLVVVIGEELWQARFGGDAHIIGRTIRVGRDMRTVVGVMPTGFRFPATEHLWLPLPPEPPGSIGASSPVRIMGRLTDGISEGQAQAELAATGIPPLADARTQEARARLRPEVVPFGLLYMGLPRGGLDALPEFRFVEFLTFALLLVACGNVAMLVFARTATRFREMAIRTSLGASRTRIVSQIFVETLVLAIVAAGVGVFAVQWSLTHVNLAAIAGEAAMPYWLSLHVSGEDLLRALVLAAVSATVAGVIPAIRITGRTMHQHLRGASGIRFGRLTGALVVADIAISVAAVGLALAIFDRARGLGESDQVAGIPAAEYLAVTFRMPDDGLLHQGTRGAGELAARTATAQRALVARLEAEPGIAAVAVGSVLPRMEHGSTTFELAGVDHAPDAPQQWVRMARVDPGFFRAVGQKVVNGRDFATVDIEGGNPTAIVNSAFVARALAEADPLGRRIRLPSRDGATDGTWYEIIGVVGHIGVNMQNAEHGDAIYLPVPAGQLNPMLLGIHATVAPATLTARVREIASQVAPDLVMGSAAVLSDVHQGDWYLIVGLAGGLILLVGVLVALATSGIYAMLSLSVSERTREIGVRTALGQQRRSVVFTILQRSLAQIGVGALLGLPIAVFFVQQLNDGSAGGHTPAMSALVAVGLAMIIVSVVALVSCAVPTRRVLAIESSVAMRAEV